MKNIVCLIGRLVSDPEIKITSENKPHSYITLAVSRDFKNSEGIYECDFISCSLWDGIASKVKEYCKKGDLVGIKGRLQSRTYEEENETKYITEIIVEKVTFLSSKKADE